MVMFLNMNNTNKILIMIFVLIEYKSLHAPELG